MWPGSLVYIHFPLWKYSNEQLCLPHCTLYICCSLHRNLTLMHIHDKAINCNIYLPYHCKICTNKNYAPQMPQICHMPTLFNVHLWEKCANIQAKYEVAISNDVARSLYIYNDDNDDVEWKWRHHSPFTYNDLATRWAWRRRCPTQRQPLWLWVWSHGQIGTTIKEGCWDAWCLAKNDIPDPDSAPATITVNALQVM